MSTPAQETTSPEAVTVEYDKNIIDGIAVPHFETAQRREDIRTHFKPRPDDVILATYPKSGTTLTQNILRHLLLPNADPDRTLDQIIPWVDFPFPSMEQIEAMPSPRIFKTHCPARWVDDMLQGSKTNKIVFCYRDPKDVAVSFYHHMKLQVVRTGRSAIPADTTFQQFYKHVHRHESLAPYGTWEQHLAGWLELTADRNMLVLKFEDLKTDTAAEIRKIAEFVGVECTDEQIAVVAEKCSFRAMKSDSKTNKSDLFVGDKFMRSGKVGGWREYLTQEQVQELDTVAADLYARFGIK